MVNRVTLTGHLGADPEAKTLQAGGVVTMVRLASTERYRDKASGSMNEHTEWHRLVFYGRLAEVARDYLTKGGRIYIDGKLRTRKWRTDTGEDRYTTEIVVEHLEMLGSARGSNQGTATPSDDRDPDIEAWAQAYERADADGNPA